MELLYNVKVVDKKDKSFDIVAENVSERKADKIEMGLLRQVNVEDYFVEIEQVN